MRDFMSAPIPKAMSIHGVYEAFKKATKTLKEGNTNLANFYLEKIVQKLRSLASTRLLSENNANMIILELKEKIRKMNLKFLEAIIHALEEVKNLIKI